MALLSHLFTKGSLALIGLGFAAAVNTGCTTGLAPSDVGTAHMIRTNRWEACVEAEGPSVLHRRAFTTPGRVLIGHEKWFLPGAPPLPCHHSIEHRYASMILFDIPLEGPRILRFVLRPGNSRPVNRHGRPASPECTVRVSIAQEVLFTGSGRMPRSVPLFPGSLRTDTIRLGSVSTSGPLHPGIDVTSIAQQWQNGDIPNLGFVVSQEVNFGDDAESTCLFSVRFEAEVEFEEAPDAGS